MNVVYTIENNLSACEFIDILHRSTLAARRPVDDQEQIEKMLRGASLIVCARVDGQLIGVSRAISDFAFCTYLSDLAVDENFQKKGIGKELVRQTHLAVGFETTLVLLSAPAAREYYPHIGMQRHDSCWIIPAMTHDTNEGR